PEVELGPVAVEEGRMAAAFLPGQDVDLGLELGVGADAAGLGQHLAPLDVVLVHAPEQAADVVAGHAFVQNLAEHLHACDHGLAGVIGEADGFNLTAGPDPAPLHTAGGHGAAAGDGEDVFHGHEEGLVDIPLGGGDVLVDGGHKLQDLLLVLLVPFQGLEGGADDDGNLVAGEVVVAQQLPDFQLHQFQQLGIIHHVGLVEEDDDIRHAYLPGQQDVLPGLGHGPVGGADHQDGPVHLGGAGDHVLDVVGVAGAVHVGVVPVVGFVLHVGGGDGDAPLPLLRRPVDLIVSPELSTALLGQHQGDGGGQSGLAVVDVTDGAHVYVGFSPFKLLLSHTRDPSPYSARSGLLRHLD